MSFLHPLEDRNTQFLLRKNAQVVPAAYPTVRLIEVAMPSIKQIEKIIKSIIVPISPTSVNLKGRP
jgi:tRNA A37 threonylcarbamoyladenosine synthetase subunit TsaC/SUA5/YrdC